MSLMEILNLRKYFSTQGGLIKAVDGVSFNVEKGDFCLIMGAQGSGKSALLKMLGGLDCPTSGKIIVDDIDIYNLKGRSLVDFRREYMGFIFQSYWFIPYLTVIENVMLAFSPDEYPLEEQRNKALTALRRVYLFYKADMLPLSLSSGEQQRVAIARALVNEPEIILADEPASGLNSAAGTGIMELLKELNGDGQTIIMASQNRNYEFYASKGVYLNGGKSVCISAPLLYSALDSFYQKRPGMAM